MRPHPPHQPARDVFSSTLANGVAQAFYPKAIDFFGPRRLRITGTLLQWTGGRLITSRDVAVDLEVVVASYQLLIKDFAYVADDPRDRPRPPDRAQRD